MAAPSGIKWGSIVKGSKDGRQGRLGIYTSVSNTNTKTTVNVQVWFWTIYSCTDSSNTFYYDAGTGVTAATTSQGSKTINHTVDSGSGWSTTNQTKLLDKTYTYTRGTSATTYKVYSKLSNIDMLSGAVYANTTYTVPALASYTVSYNANGGGGAPSSQTKWYGKILTLSPTKPTRTGYSFQGWATSASGGVAYAAGASYTANATVTLYAVWKANTYTVSYNANGGTGAPGPDTKTYGVTLTLSSTKPTRTNYNFLGWATSASATSATYAAGGSYTANNGVTLYAVWELAYVKPLISSLTVTRCDSSGAESDDGTYAMVEFDWKTTNAVSEIKIAWESASAWSGSATVTASGTSGNVSQRIGGTLSTEATYSISVYIQDGGGYSYAFATLNGAAYAIDFLTGGKGAAFGKPAELEDVLDIKFKTRMLGGMMPVVLEAETDLNTILIPGTYTGANLSHYNYVNCPVSSGTFTLLVESCGEAGQVKQTYTSCSMYKPERYSRFYYQGDWQKNAKDEYVWFWANTDEYVMYENESGSTATISLPASLSHFRYIEIYYTDNNGLTGGYTKIYSPNGKTACLSIIEASTATSVFMRQTLYRLSGTTITPVTESAGYIKFGSNAISSSVFGTNYIKIVRVIGRA